MKPSIGLVLNLIPRWSCSIRLLRYLEDRSFVRLDSSPSSCISRTARCDVAVEGDHVRRPALVPDRLDEESLRGRHIPSTAKPEIDSLSGFVHRSIEIGEIGPLAAYLDISLIDSPGATSGPSKTIPAFDEFWCIPADPTQNRRMGDLQPAFGHHLDQITKLSL